MQVGFVGCSDDAEYMRMIMMLGASPGPFKRERRTACSRMVSEIYSPPRVTHAISSMPGCGLLPVLALDLTCVGPFDGKPWDFDFADKRDRAQTLFRKQRPAVLIGSPCCTAWSTWQALNKHKRDPEVIRREMIKARVHLDFIISLYIEQIGDGRLLLHEHPAGAASWQEDGMKTLEKFPGVERINADQCQHGAEVSQGCAGDHRSRGRLAS